VGIVATSELSAQDYAVLGLIGRHGPMTPYELKARVQESLDYFWPVPHAQLYRIPPRLAERDLLREEAEEGGRRRRVFHLTAAGRTALRDWLADPEVAQPETRDPAQLKLFFVDLGEPADVVALARRQADQHRRWLELYRTFRDELADGPTGGDGVPPTSQARILRLGVVHEQTYVDFWERLAAHPEDLDL